MPIELVPLSQESKMAMELVPGLLATSLVAGGAVMAKKSISISVSSLGELRMNFKENK